MIKPLSTNYSSCYGMPVISLVDISIFTRNYFAFCRQCDFCNDGCCSYGVEAALEEISIVEKYADALEEYMRTPRNDWFEEQEGNDEGHRGGKFRRTRVQDRGCVFLNKKGRGCMIHSFSLEQGMDYHMIKPMLCCLFPTTIDNGLLRPAYDAQDGSLICLVEGLSLYRGVRDELLFYFGKEFTNELDQMEIATIETIGGK